MVVLLCSATCIGGGGRVARDIGLLRRKRGHATFTGARVVGGR